MSPSKTAFRAFCHDCKDHLTKEVLKHFRMEDSLPDFVKPIKQFKK